MNATSDRPILHVLYENPDWNPPLIVGYEAEGFDVRLMRIADGLFDPTQAPPEGLFLNRMSPSSHTRGHTASVGLMREVLGWLEAHGRTVLHGSTALEIEMSKFRQDILLRKHGIRTPKTLLAIGRDAILAAAEQFDGPFITKHNQGGKGLGIVLFDSADQLRTYLDSDSYDPGPEHKLILQQYIKPPGGYITRVELVADRFLFAMRSSTADGFELCPADACQMPDLDATPDVCPADGPADKFTASPLTADDPLVQKYLNLMRAEGLHFAGIEFVTDADGLHYTYDINGTTNYNGALGEQIGIHGMQEQARYVKRVVLGAGAEQAAA